jgi:hypothetical protein
MCTSVARGVPLSLAVRCRTRVGSCGCEFQTDVSRQSALATAMRGMQPADATTATGDKCDRDGDGDVGRARHVNRQVCIGRDATPRHALGACGGDSGQPARRRGLAEGAEGAHGAEGADADAKRRKGRGSVWWAGWQHGRWQHGRIAGSKGARRRRGSVSSGTAAARHQSEIGRGVLGRVSTVPGWGMGGRHGGMGLRAVGNLPERCSQGAHSQRAHPRHSFNSKASRASTGCPRLLGRGLAASGLQHCSSERQASAFGPSACVYVCGRACVLDAYVRSLELPPPCNSAFCGHCPAALDGDDVDVVD